MCSSTYFKETIKVASNLHSILETFHHPDPNTKTHMRHLAATLALEVAKATARITAAAHRAGAHL